MTTHLSIQLAAEIDLTTIVILIALIAKRHTSQPQRDR
jgi:hypothetical protein